MNRRIVSVVAEDTLPQRQRRLNTHSTELDRAKSRHGWRNVDHRIVDQPVDVAVHKQGKSVLND